MTFINFPLKKTCHSFYGLMLLHRHSNPWIFHGVVVNDLDQDVFVKRLLAPKPSVGSCSTFLLSFMEIYL